MAVDTPKSSQMTESSKLGQTQRTVEHVAEKQGPNLVLTVITKERTVITSEAFKALTGAYVSETLADKVFPRRPRLGGRKYHRHTHAGGIGQNGLNMVGRSLRRFGFAGLNVYDGKRTVYVTSLSQIPGKPLPEALKAPELSAATIVGGDTLMRAVSLLPKKEIGRHIAEDVMAAIAGMRKAGVLQALLYVKQDGALGIVHLPRGQHAYARRGDLIAV